MEYATKSLQRRNAMDKREIWQMVKRATDLLVGERFEPSGDNSGYIKRLGDPLAAARTLGQLEGNLRAELGDWSEAMAEDAVKE